MILVVAEKPSVGRDIARVLGAGARGEGCLSGGEYIVTWALGHLVALCDPDEINPEWKKWRRDTLPMLPETLKTKVLPKTRAQFSAVKKLMLDKRVERLICATDSGREGELIFRYIYRQAGCKKPFDRLWINSMTDAAIREGFAKLKPSAQYDALFESARCRSEADWLVGMNASRAFTLRYDALLSVGRVQTPTLALIVKRDDEIARFVPRDYFELRADFGDYTGLWLHPQTGETRSFEKEPLEKARKEILGKDATIQEVIKEKKRARPPQLYDLTTLQREANTRFGFSAKKTLDIAQALYEKHKLLTYPRTDSRCLPNDMAPVVTKTLGSAEGELANFASALLPQPPRPKRVYDDSKISDHHAIVPTGARVSGKALTADEAKIYEMVFRRLIAALYPDYEYESTRVLTACQGHTFRSSGTVPLEMGWKALYTFEKKDEDGEEQLLPELHKGDMRAVKDAKLSQKKEKPPARMTTASLLTQMEQAGRELDDEELRDSMKDSGLGTPATRAAIIERLKDVGYIAEQGKALVSTQKGRNLIAVAPPEITSAETTGKWEKALSKMARSGGGTEAKVQADRFLESIRRYAAFLVDAAEVPHPDVRFEREERRSGGKAPAKRRATAKTDEPSAPTIKKSSRTAKTESADVETPKRTRTRKAPNTQRTVSAQKDSSEAPNAIKRRAETVPGAVCPLCGSGVLETERAFGCADWRNGCGFTVWKNAAQRLGGGAIDRTDFLSLLRGESREKGGVRVRLIQGKTQIERPGTKPQGDPDAR